MPWTWARVLRDHGPKSRDFICAMLTLRTWMDEAGFAYPSLRTWAAGARMAVNTLRRHLDAAVKGGWLGVEVSRSRSHGNVYRCAVPLDTQLSEKDETLCAALIAQHGDIESPLQAPSSNFGVSAMSDTRTRANGAGVSAMSDTRTDWTGVSEVRVSNGATVACQNTPLRVSNYADGVSAESRNPLSSLETRKEVLEVLELPEEEGAVASNITERRLPSATKKPELFGRARLEAKKLIVAKGIGAAVDQYRLTKVEAEELLRECKIGHSRVVV